MTTKICFCWQCLFNKKSALTRAPLPTRSDESYTLPHNQDLSIYPHFDDVTLYMLPERSSVDVLINFDKSALMGVAQEKTGKEEELHAIETRLAG